MTTRMAPHRWLVLAFQGLYFCGLAHCADTVSLWTEKTPHWTAPQEAEADTSTPDSGNVANRPVIRLGNVSQPELHLFPAENSQTTIIVCPGGGYSILAWDLEGTEIAAWFQKNGVSAAVLKYRVPTRNEDQRWKPPVQDIQRAISLVRSGQAGKASSSRVGILGFSAGGNACAHAATATRRYYEPSDESDKASWKPDFAALVYPAYLLAKDAEKDRKVENPLELASELKITKDSPPMFFAHAFDDRISCLGSVAMFAQLKKYEIPSALHVFSGGGHGFGGRQVGQQLDHWLPLCKAWLVDNGWAQSSD